MQDFFECEQTDILSYTLHWFEWFLKHSFLTLFKHGLRIVEQYSTEHRRETENEIIF